MKKVVACLLAFALIFAFAGCDLEGLTGGPGIGPGTEWTTCEVCGAEEKGDCICKMSIPGLPNDLKEWLTDNDFDEDAILAPKGAQFHDWEAGNGVVVGVFWKGANKYMFAAYQKAWEDKGKAAVNINNYADWTVATISFYEEAGVDAGTQVEYPANTIVFIGSGTKKQ